MGRRELIQLVLIPLWIAHRHLLLHSATFKYGKQMEEKPTVAANGFPILYDKTMMSYWVLDKIRDAWKHISQKK